MEISRYQQFYKEIQRFTKYLRWGFEPVFMMLDVRRMYLAPKKTLMNPFSLRLPHVPYLSPFGRPTKISVVTSVIESQQSWEDFACCKLDIAQGDSDFEYPDFVASRACCLLGEHRAPE
jgi:hypothetical protein